MKKNLFLLVALLIPVYGFAQTQSVEIGTSQMIEQAEFEKELFSVMDMKIFHDRQIMQDVLLQLAEQQNNPTTVAEGTRDKMTKNIFNERDSDILETAMDDKRVQYDITPELLKKANEMPFEAFKDLIRSAIVPKLTKQDMEELNQVDDQAISQMLQMTTESGPDIGARPVSVLYGNEI